jgi:cell division protein FtsI (penicillin-binding protein 3)
VTVGTGKAAAIQGYTVAGKTGTARKPLDGARGYKTGAYVATFAGFVPAEAPRLSGIVILDEPTPIYGGTVSAPVFATVSQYALRLYRIPPPPAGSVVDVPPVDVADAEKADGAGDPSASVVPLAPAPAASLPAAPVPTAPTP